jgi:hypothetical protein
MKYFLCGEIKTRRVMDENDYLEHTYLCTMKNHVLDLICC